MSALGAGREHHGLRRLQPVDRAIARRHLDRALAGEAAGPSNERDVLALEPPELPVVGPVVRHVVALRERGSDVDLSGDRLRCAGHPTSRREHVARSDERLRRDATPVRALPADELLLDERDLQAAVGTPARRVLPRGSPADHDHVVSLDVGHECSVSRCSVCVTRSVARVKSSMQKVATAAGIFGPAAFTVAFTSSERRQEGYSIRDEHISGLAAPDARNPEVLLTGFLVMGAIDDLVRDRAPRAPGRPARRDRADPARAFGRRRDRRRFAPTRPHAAAPSRPTRRLPAVMEERRARHLRRSDLHDIGRGAALPLPSSPTRPSPRATGTARHSRHRPRA